MPQKKCNENCLECKLPKCYLDILDERAAINKKFKDKSKVNFTKYYKEHQEEILEKDKKRHAEYYKEHKAEIDAKQKEYDSKYRTAEKNHSYYMEHKAEINKKNQERYANNREARLQQAKEYYWQHREEISIRRKLKRRGITVGQQEVL